MSYRAQPWPHDLRARAAFGITSAIVTAALVLQLILSLTKDRDVGSFESTPARTPNFFSFFTVQSNIAVAITTGMLARRLGRSSLLFRVFRLDAMICILVTGVVIHLALTNLQELTRWDKLADFPLHTLSPILCPLFLGLAFGALAIDRKLPGERT